MDLLLVAWEWHPRMLLRAQLVEEGYEVLALSGWDEAELILLKRAAGHAAIIFDLDGEPHPSAALHSLVRLVPPDRVLILTAGGAPAADEVRRIGFPRVLARPFSVGQVVSQIASMIGPPRERTDGPTRGMP